MKRNDNLSKCIFVIGLLDDIGDDRMIGVMCATPILVSLANNSPYYVFLPESFSRSFMYHHFPFAHLLRDFANNQYISFKCSYKWKNFGSIYEILVPISFIRLKLERNKKETFVLVTFLGSDRWRNCLVTVQISSWNRCDILMRTNSNW